jgi:hypothetical protein
MKMWVAVAGAAWILACGGSGPPVQVQPQPLSIDERVFYDEDAGIRDSTAFEIRDRAMLEQTWGQITSSWPTRRALADYPGLANVDFQRNMLLVVAPGMLFRGDRVQIERITRAREADLGGRQQEILLVEFTVQQGCRTITGAAYPLEIVRVPRYAGTVRFQGTRRQATGCE